MHVHDLVPHLKEQLGRKWLGEKICQVFRGVDVLRVENVVFHKLAHIEVAPVDMFCTVVELWIV